MSNTQSPIQFGGSFMVAVVCKDGILVAADSRGTLKSLDQRLLAYYDGVQKIFPLNQSVIAYTGEDFIQNIHFAVIVHDMFKTRSTDVEKILPSLIEFSDTLPKEARDKLRAQHLVAAGFTDGRPNICYFNEAQTEGQKYQCGNRLVSSDRTTLDTYRSKLLSMESTEVTPLAVSAIKDYAQQRSDLEIGGPVFVRLLTTNDSKWLSEAPPSHEWTYLHDFVRDYRKGIVKLTLLPGVKQTEIDDLMEKAESWSRREIK